MFEPTKQSSWKVRLGGANKTEVAPDFRFERWHLSSTARRDRLWPGSVMVELKAQEPGIVCCPQNLPLLDPVERKPTMKDLPQMPALHKAMGRFLQPCVARMGEVCALCKAPANRILLWCRCSHSEFLAWVFITNWTMLGRPAAKKDYIRNLKKGISLYD